MTFVHSFAARGDSGLVGMQADQRDWSPFVVHFTKWAAMAPLRRAYKDKLTASEVKQRLTEADDQSWEVFQAIVSSKSIQARQLTNKDGNPHPILPCICLSECALPGLLGHAERYGRFGFVFRKEALWELGARPCLYVDADHYELIEAQLKENVPRLYSLYNKHVPPHALPADVTRQDFTLEREWRSFNDIELGASAPCCVVVPDERFVGGARRVLAEAGVLVDFVLPLDTMFKWGV